jgi:hypothetical protein
MDKPVESIEIKDIAVGVKQEELFSGVVNKKKTKA